MIIFFSFFLDIFIAHILWIFSRGQVIKPIWFEEEQKFIHRMHRPLNQCKKKKNFLHRDKNNFIWRKSESPVAVLISTVFRILCFLLLRIFSIIYRKERYANLHLKPRTSLQIILTLLSASFTKIDKLVFDTNNNKKKTE